MIQVDTPKPTDGNRIRLFHLALLVLAAAALSAHPVPWSNELYYLIRLEAFWNSDLFGSDWLLSSPSPEHFVFNALFGLLPLLLPIEIVGWIGRISCWIATLYLIARFALNFRIPAFLVTASILLWLFVGQSTVGGEWVVKGFEAKCISYILLFIALDRFIRRKENWAAACLGLCVSFHPGVGIWAMVAFAAGVLTARQLQIAQLIRVGVIAGIFALPGLIPILLRSKGIEGTPTGDWEYLARVLMREHFDPFSWPKRDVFALYVLYLFNLLHGLRNRSESPFRFLLGFEGALCAVFTMGIVWRAMENYELLKYMPFRLFPVFALLLFFLHLSRAFVDFSRSLSRPLLASIGVLALIALPNAFGETFDRFYQIHRAWTSPPIREAACLDWIRTSSRPNSITIAPPWIREAWWRSRRAEFVNYYFIPYDRLPEWRKRMESLGAKLALPSGNHPLSFDDQLTRGYQGLSLPQIEAIAAKYGANLFVSGETYGFPIRFENESCRVYDLSGIAAHDFGK